MDYKHFKGKHASIVIEIISLLEKGLKSPRDFRKAGRWELHQARKQQWGYAH